MGSSFTVSTHSRLKAAGDVAKFGGWRAVVSTHSRLKAAGDVAKFGGWRAVVSTHSRLKAAAAELSRQTDALRFQHTAA